MPGERTGLHHPQKRRRSIIHNNFICQKIHNVCYSIRIKMLSQLMDKSMLKNIINITDFKQNAKNS